LNSGDVDFFRSTPVVAALNMPNIAQSISLGASATFAASPQRVVFHFYRPLTTGTAGRRCRRMPAHAHRPRLSPRTLRSHRPDWRGCVGKVWRARPTALRRDDALKVLPDAFASDPNRLARFRVSDEHVSEGRADTMRSHAALLDGTAEAAGEGEVDLGRRSHIGEQVR
jgi:hypothetical protein